MEYKKASSYKWVRNNCESVFKQIGGDMKIRGFNINSTGFMEE